MKTKAEFLAELRRRQSEIPENMAPQAYLLRCVEVMFDLGAEVMAGMAGEDEDPTDYAASMKEASETWRRNKDRKP